MTTTLNSTTTIQATKDIVYNRDTKDYSCFLIIDGERNLIGTVERYHDGEVLCNDEYLKLLEDNADVSSDDELTEETYNGENETLEYAAKQGLVQDEWGDWIDPNAEKLSPEEIAQAIEEGRAERRRDLSWLKPHQVEFFKIIHQKLYSN